MGLAEVCQARLGREEGDGVKHAYTPGFQQAWSRYPHYEQRSKKVAAFRVWERDELEDEAEQVCKVIDAYRRSEDATKDGGQYVGGMQVWLKDRDFDEEPVASHSAPIPFRNRQL